ncbi:MAG: hypothetical protein V4556_02660 [Bacteroidota bacterium]
MKILLLKIACALLFLFLTVAGFAQKTNNIVKQPLFSKFPSTINCTVAELSKFFAVAQGQSANVSFDNTFKANGVIASNVVKYNNLHSLAIKLPEFNNAIFALSKRIDENNNVIYTGRIINQLSADAYELKKIDDTKYQLIKINLETILPTCDQ